MQMMQHTVHPALVTKPGLPERYLLLSPSGQPDWVDAPEAATTFESMVEAARMAVRLPSNLRAFGLPRHPEVTLHRPV